MKSQTKLDQPDQSSSLTVSSSSTVSTSSSTVLSVLSISADGKQAHLHRHTHTHTEFQQTSLGIVTSVVTDVDIDKNLGPDGLEQKEVRTTTVTTAPVDIHPFDLLVKGQEYNVYDFTGSCPKAVAPLKAIAGGQDPKWKHSKCTLKVLDQDEKKGTKHIQLDATVAAGNNITVGLSDSYSVELTLRKDETGKIICTAAKGSAGKLAFPTGFLPLLKGGSAVAHAGFALVSGATSLFRGWGGSAQAAQAAPAATPVLGWDDVEAYGTPANIEQKIEVILQPQADGNFKFKVKIDPNEPNALILDGMSARLLSVSKSLGLASKAKLKGSIDLLHPVAKPSVQQLK